MNLNNVKKIESSVWLFLQRSVGKASVLDIQDLLAISFFIKKAQTKIESYEEKYTLGYLSLTFGKVLNAEMLCEYIYQIETDVIGNHFISERLKECLSNISKIDVSFINETFDFVENITQGETDNLYDILMLVLVNIGGYRGKGYYNNLSLIKLESAIINCKEGMTILDDFCGIGVSANEIANCNGKVYLQDVNQECVAMASVVTYLKGTEIGSIACSDSLLNNNYKSFKFDIVAVEPDFGIKRNNEYIKEIPNDNIVSNGIDDNESIEIRHVLSKLKNDGIAMILVGAGLLFKSGRFARTREKLLEDKNIDAIIELPPGVFHPYTNIATALIILRKNKTDDTVYFYNTKQCFEREKNGRLTINDENINIVAKAYHSKTEIDGVCKNVPIEEVVRNGSVLFSAQYLYDKSNNMEVEDLDILQNEYNKLSKSLLEIESKLTELRNLIIF